MSTDRRPAVVFIADPNMLECLQVALASLLQNLDRSAQPPCWIVVHGFTAADRAEIAHLASSIRPDVAVGFLNYVPSPLISHGLHGNFMSVAKLRLADLFPAIDHVLYLDSDIVVNCDIAPLLAESTRMAGLIGAVASGTVKNSLDVKAYRAMGMPDEMPTFNSGVMSLNLARWRVERPMDLLQSESDRLGAILKSSDQGIFNIIARGAFHRLAPRFNTLLSPTSAPLAEGTEGIFHFFGSPKPFDPLGRMLNRNWKIYDRFRRRSASRRLWPKHPASTLVRVWKLRFSYLRAFKAFFLRP